jgi:hypothetical protein
MFGYCFLYLGDYKVMWNPFSKKNEDDDNEIKKPGLLERLALKKFESMNDEQRMKLMRKAMDPKNIAKNKDKILGTLKQMRKSGQITADQYEMAKQKMGIRE